MSLCMGCGCKAGVFATCVRCQSEMAKEFEKYSAQARDQVYIMVHFMNDWLSDWLKEETL